LRSCHDSIQPAHLFRRTQRQQVAGALAAEQSPSQNENCTFEDGGEESEKLVVNAASSAPQRALGERAQTVGTSSRYESDCRRRIEPVGDEVGEAQHSAQFGRKARAEIAIAIRK